MQKQLIKEIDHTTYIINIHFNDHSNATIKDRIITMIKNITMKG